MLNTPAVVTAPVAAHAAQVFAVRWPALAAKCNSRLQRAITIATTPEAIRPAEKDGLFVVQSESNPLGHYVVDIPARACTCPDHGKHGAAGLICKHRLAVAIVTGLIAPVEDPAPAEAPAEAPADERQIMAEYEGHTVVVEDACETLAYIRADEDIFGGFASPGARANGAPPVFRINTGWVRGSELANLRLVDPDGILPPEIIL